MTVISDHVAELRRLSTHPTTQQYYSSYVAELLNSSADVIEQLRGRTSRAANTGTIQAIDNLDVAQRRAFIADVFKQNSDYRKQIVELQYVIQDMLDESEGATESAKNILKDGEL